MDRILKLFVLLFGFGFLTACGDKPYVSQPACLTSGACVQTAVAGGGLRGTEETLVGVTDAAGAESLMVRSGYGLGREIVRDAASGVIHALTGTVLSNIAGSCGGNNCGGGNTYVMQGGTAVSQAEANSDSEAGVTFTSTLPCLYALLPNGECPAMPVN